MLHWLRCFHTPDHRVLSFEAENWPECVSLLENLSVLAQSIQAQDHGGGQWLSSGSIPGRSKTIFMFTTATRGA
jgi:hypothetical protein